MALTCAEFTRMVHDHGPVLYRMAYRMMGDGYDAEDVVQETFRDAWKSRGNYEAGRGERAWLAAILRRRLADRWRRRKLPSVLVPDLQGQISVDADDPLADEYTDEMQHALAQLPSELRETLLLVVVAELTHQETADLLAIPLGTVLSRVSRARGRLRENLVKQREKAAVPER